MPNRRSSDSILIEMAGTVGKMSGTIESIHEKVDKIDDKFEHHEDRISLLEGDKHKIIGAAFGVSAVVSFIVGVAGWILK